MRWVVAVKPGADEDALRRIVMERCGQLVRTATISFGLWCQDFDLCGQACEVWHRATLMRNRIAEFAAVTGRTPIGLVLDGCVYELTPDGSAKRHLFIELGVGRYVLTGMDAIISVEDQSISATERQRRASEGARVEVVELPDPGVLYALTNLINKAEAATIHGTWVRTRRDDYSLSAVNRFEAGFHIPATQYLDAMRLRGRLLADFARRVFERVDLVHMPVLGIPVPTIEETEIRSTAAVPQLMERITRYTRWVNYLGLPALSVPCGYSANGLPVAFQLLGRPFSEARLLRVAHVYQQATKHHERRPPE